MFFLTIFLLDDDRTAVYSTYHYSLAYFLCVQEQHHNMVQYELAIENLSLSFLFGKMEEAQRDMQVEDYSVCQNNLDNVSTIMRDYHLLHSYSI